MATNAGGLRDTSKRATHPGRVSAARSTRLRPIGACEFNQKVNRAPKVRNVSRPGKLHTPAFTEHSVVPQNSVSRMVAASIGHSEPTTVLISLAFNERRMSSKGRSLRFATPGLNGGWIRRGEAQI